MKAFEDYFSDQGIEAKFDTRGIFTCILEPEAEKDVSLSMTAYSDIQARMLRIAITANNEIPNNTPISFYREIAEKAIQPLRGGVGVGIFESENRVTVYQSLKISTLTKELIEETINLLVEHIEEWDKKLLNAQKRSEKSTVNTKTHAKNFNFTMKI